MVKQTIQIFGRIKPTKGKVGPYEINTDEDDGSAKLYFTVPRDLQEGIVNNKKELFTFRFNRVFDRNTKQDEVFEYVAKPVIDNVISGYNGTIFAYGQTGSGKTFTITGGAERYTDRGIIPRTLSYIFEYYKENPDWEYTTHISYLELYNESGYDLLDPKHEASKLEDLPKVSLLEDADQNIHLKNLSTHLASNEEEALNLLFVGDTNRMIAETPMNQASTRSHCIFTIHLSSREAGSATLRRAKLHLVDLAGSERVGKTGVDGQLLAEAKYINMSLHHLEHVIVSLSEKNRKHVPYRNSMMTSVLRDSLGGNCMTTMIATCSVESKNFFESISTCRFAQRVAMIKNDAILNEELDPKLMIAKLKKEVAHLKEELAMATGEQRTDALSKEDLERCEEMVKEYIQAADPDFTIRVGADMRKIHQCFWIMKKQILERKPTPQTSPPNTHELPEPTPRDGSDLSPVAVGDIKKLKDILQQRDNEINILVNMLKKEKKRATDAINQLDQTGGGHPGSTYSEGPSLNGHEHKSSRMAAGFAGGESNHQRRRASSMDAGLSGKQSKKSDSREPSDIEEKTKKKILGELSMGRQEAFEIFRRDYDQNQSIEENKQVLKQRYAEAKTLGEIVNRARTTINKLKGSIEQHRVSRVMQGLVDPENPEPDDMELDMKRRIEDEKNVYKDAFGRLRNLKTEIEHLQHLLEKSKVKLMKDFEIWWAEQGALNQEKQLPYPAGHAKNAWKTPPMSPSLRGQKQINSPGSLTSILSDQSGSTGVDPISAPIPGHIRQSLANGNTGIPARGGDANVTKSRSQNKAGNIPLTGDAQADADILAFLKARQQILKHPQYKGNR